MGMHSSIYGFKPVDKKYKKMEEIYNLCVEQGIEPPEKVGDFFNWEQPDPCGVCIDIESSEAITEYHEDMQEGFEVDLTKLSDDITIIRFVNSY